MTAVQGEDGGGAPLTCPEIAQLQRISAAEGLATNEDEEEEEGEEGGDPRVSEPPSAAQLAQLGGAVCEARMSSVRRFTWLHMVRNETTRVCVCTLCTRFSTSYSPYVY